MAMAMVEGAEKRGELRPGMKVVEYSGGSTGSSLAFVCAVKGYQCKIVSSDAFAQEKLDTMRAFGAELDVVPSDNGMDTLGIIGIRPEYYYSSVSFIESLTYGYNGTINSFGLITLTFKMLGSGQASLKDLGGPIMIGQIAGETAKAGWIPLMNFMALISINLALLNILPIPGLDGGHIFIILIE